MARLNLSPAFRLAIGLAMMTTCLLIGLDLATGLVPDPIKASSRVRVVIAEALAGRLTQQLGQADDIEWHRTLARARQSHPEIVVAALRTDDGRILASAGAQDKLAPPRPDDRSTIDRMIVPIERNEGRWGRLEIVYEPVYPQTLAGWLTMPMSLTLLGLIALGVPLYGLYLRRALQLLDPSNAVPDRVRAAFDTLAEGVVVLDRNGRVVLANQVFRDMVPDGNPEILGKRAADLPWLTGALANDGTALPWIAAIERNEAIDNVAVEIHRPQPRTAETTAADAPAAIARYVLCANPITDGAGQRRGCILTFDDVSTLHERNEQLRSAMQALESHQARIEDQNVALHRLASRDPMTDCLNRRAFFEEAATVWVKAISDERHITLAMCDIDFFKKVNDQYGHAAGDQVIKATADWLRSVSRSEDLVCRMGGEEFCVVWTRLPPEQSFERAERLRRTVEEAPPIMTEAGQALKVTMSVGVICAQPSTRSVEMMIEQADQALYEAKRSGRNRVVEWPFRPGEVAAPADTASSTGQQPGQKPAQKPAERPATEYPTA